jgi:hypothetical protein
MEGFMKRNSNLNSMVFLAAISAATASGGVFAEGDVLRSSNLDEIGRWYGRAGGLVGADRISSLGRAHASRVGVSYDKDLAARTNMALDRREGDSIAITQDKELMSRTNMGAGFENKAPTQTVAKSK